MALTQEQLQVPPTEAELSKVIALVNLADTAMGNIFRRLAHQRDRLKKDLQDIQARLILCEEVAAQLYGGDVNATATTAAYYRKFPEDFEDEQKEEPTDAKIKEHTMKPGCYDCGLPYGSPAWVDVVIPDDMWQKISPTGHSGGVLCFNCMNKRLHNLGLINVPYDIASGPFAFHIRQPTEEIQS